MRVRIERFSGQLEGGKSVRKPLPQRGYYRALFAVTLVKRGRA